MEFTPVKYFFAWLILILSFIIMGFWDDAYSMGKKPLADFSLLKVENAKLADRMSGIENAQLKLADKLDGQISTIGYMKGDISKVSQQTSVGGDMKIYNDSIIFKEQLNAQIKITELNQKAAKDREDAQKQLNYWLIGVIVLLINQVFKFFNKYIDYKEAYIKKLDPATADEELGKMKAERKKKTLVGKATSLYKKAILKQEDL